MIFSDDHSIRGHEPTAGVFLAGKTYVWSEALDAASAASKHLRERIHTGVNAAAFVAAFVCFSIFAALKLFIPALIQRGNIDVIEVFFRPNIGGLFLSLSFLFGAFVFYRVCEASRLRLTVPNHTDSILEISSPPATGEHVNIALAFQPATMAGLAEAEELARRFSHASLEPLHLFLGLLSRGDVPVIFGRLGLTFDSIRDAVGRHLQSQPTGEAPVLSSEAERTLLVAFINASQQNLPSVSPIEVFYAAYQRNEFLREMLYGLNVDEARFANVVEWIRITDQLRERYDRFRRAAAYKPTGPMNRSMTSVATHALDAFSIDLTTAAVRGELPMLVGRTNEMEEMLRVIESSGKSVLLVGPEGVGKESMISGLAERMVQENVPEVLKDKRLVQLSVPHVVAGASSADAQERLLAVLVDVSRARNIVLVIPQIEQLTGLLPGSAIGPELGALLGDALSRGLFVIATCTPQAYTSSVERSSLASEFERVNVSEPDTTGAIHVLESKVGGIEYEQHVVFTFEAVEKAVELSDRYLHDAFLPAKAIQVAREAALLVSREKGANALVAGADIEKIVTQKTGIPLTHVGKEESDTLLHLEEKIHERVIGQDEAVKAIASALRRARTALRATNRPIANFLFLGPSGVGKTALAKAVSATYFGNENAMLRFDMSEYQDPSSAYRLIGMPGGEPGLLTEAVRRQPFSLILLDEFEKAHPNILNLFLQVFDEGRLTDSSGRTVDFTSSIIVATSNAGTAYIQDAVKRGEPVEQIRTHLLNEELRGTYRPELLNRFDGAIVFTPLTPDDVLQIAYLMVHQLAERLETKGIRLRATDEFIMDLARKGYDPTFGARPLRRVIQDEVDNAIAKVLLEGRAGRRDTLVLHPGGEITVEKAVIL